MVPELVAVVSVAQGANKLPLRNVLIISEDNNANNPDDRRRGGTLFFSFDSPVMMDEVHLLDIDSSGTQIRLYNSSGVLINHTSVPNRGDNSFQIVTLDARGVSRMEIVLDGSGAVAAIVSCRNAEPIPVPPSKFFVVDTNDQTFRYSSAGTEIGQFSVSAAINARDVTTTATGNPLWVLSEEGSKDRVYVYDSRSEKLLGSWNAQNVTTPEGIATNGTDIWIVDDANNRVNRYAGAASRRADKQNRSDYFELANGNQNPKGITTDGQYLWVVDSTSDKVFVYNLHGLCINWWNLDPANSDPSGITVNPSGTTLWVVDHVDRRVYSYSKPILSYLGSQSASGKFPLAWGNSQPTGIADPGAQIQIGATVADSMLAGEVKEWTFDAAAGQRIYVNMQDLTGLGLFNDGQIHLFDPGGSLVYSKSGYRNYQLDSGPLTLISAGTYALRLTTPLAASFQFTIFNIPPAEGTPINFGQVYSGAIDTPGSEDHWTFSGAMGDKVYLDALTLNTVVGGDMVLAIQAPDGSTISSRSFTREYGLDQQVVLPITGTYTIIARPDFGGSHLPTYSFQLWKIPDDDVATIALRELAIGAIEIAGARDRWNFSATEGQEVFIDFLEVTGGDLEFSLIAPDGVVITSGAFSREYGLDRQLVLPQSGVYTLIANASSGASTLNTYQFRVWDIPLDVPSPALLNAPLVGDLVPGQTTTYLVHATAGSQLFIDVLDSSSRAIGMSLIAPDGTTLIDRATLDTLVTLPVTGTYRAVVQRSSDDILAFDNQGPYVFRLQDASSPQLGGRDSLGTQFFLAFPRNLRDLFGATNPDLSVTITANVTTSGTVQIPSLNWFVSYDVTAGGSTTIALPPEVEIYNPDVISEQAVLVTALDEVAVYGLNQIGFSTDGYAALADRCAGHGVSRARIRKHDHQSYLLVIWRRHEFDRDCYGRQFAGHYYSHADHRQSSCR